MLDTDVKLVYQRPAGLTDRVTHYCPGCTHGVAHRLIAEVLEEMGELGNTIGVAPVGCAVFAYNYLTFDFVEAPHGRAPAMATGIKRTLPNKMVFTYQGDGDLASIGMGEIVAAAARGEQFTTIFINNTNYGMTGGQMAPTTLPGQKTTSSPLGRDVERQGYPIRTAELLSICPTNWGMNTENARIWLAEHMLPFYPVGDFKVSPVVKNFLEGAKL